MIAAGALDRRWSRVFSARRFHVHSGCTDDRGRRLVALERSTASAIAARARRATPSPPRCWPPASTHCRTTPVTGAPRAPYCMMGVCFDCLVTIDGVGNRQGCLVPVREGMRIETQQRQAGGRHDDARAIRKREAYDVVVDRRRARRALPPRRSRAQAGLATVLLDENPGAGGQIYRAITSTPVRRPQRCWAPTIGRAPTLARRCRGERRRRSSPAPRSGASIRNARDRRVDRRRARA